MNSAEQLLVLDSGIQTILPENAPQTVSPQIVYLDFDGAETSYHNAALGLDIDDITVAPSGIGNDTIFTIVSALNERFGDDIVFTADQPDGDDYSTIYIGVTSAFDEYGNFIGLAETIDSGNLIRDDNAFVLLDSTASTELVTSVIAHETDHIVSGMEHGGEGLEAYAKLVYNSSSLSRVIIVSGNTVFHEAGQFNSIFVNVRNLLMNRNSF